MPQYISQFENVLDQEFCNKMIDKFKSDSRTMPDPQPDYSTRRFLNLSLCDDWIGFISPLLEKTNAIAEEYFAVPEGMESVAVSDWIDDGFIMSHYRKGDDLILHVDGQNSEEGFNGLRLGTVVFFLATSEGGELHFPLQDVCISPVAGRAVMFPPVYTHPHEVLKVKSDRYIVQTWLTHPQYKVVEY